MHQQLGGSPKDTASNMRAILEALADINIGGIAPSFDPPHIRVVVEDDAFDTAYDAMATAGLAPTVHSAVTVTMTDTPKALKTALDRLERMGYEVDAILVLPSQPSQGQVQVSFGIKPRGIAGWTDAQAESLGEVIGDGL